MFIPTNRPDNSRYLLKTPPCSILTQKDFRPPSGFLTVARTVLVIPRIHQLQNTSQLGTAGSSFPDLAAEGPAMKAVSSSSETGRRVSRRTAFPSLSSVSVPCTTGGSHQTQWCPSAVSHSHSGSRLCFHNECKTFKFPLSLGSNSNLNYKVNKCI